MNLSPEERRRMESAALGQLLRNGGRGHVVGYGDVVFHSATQGPMRLRVERTYDEMTTGYADRVFLKVNRIGGSGL